MIPRVSGWAALSSRAKCEGWKSGAVHWDVLPAGEVDGVGGLSLNGIYWGLSSWAGQRLEVFPGRGSWCRNAAGAPGQWLGRTVAAAMSFPSRAPGAQLGPPSQHTQQLPCSRFSLQGVFGSARV